MKRLFNIITKRSTTALVLLLFEIVVSSVVVIFVFGGAFLAFGVLSYIFNVFIMFLVVNSKSNPAYKISWIFTVILLPLVGGVLYIAFGKRRTVKKLKRKFLDVKRGSFDCFNEGKCFIKDLDLNMDVGCLQMVRWVFNVSKQPVYDSTQTEFLGSGNSYFKSLLKDLGFAKRSIFLEVFIISPGKMWGEILNILINKAKDGVDVRLIYDDFGTIASLPNGYSSYMNKLGIKCKVFNPIKPRFEAFMNNRDHRKMVVIDGNIAYTGGINFADEYINEVERFGFWQDCGVRLYGKAAISFVVLFLNMWNYLSDENLFFRDFIPNDFNVESDGFVMPFGDNPVNSYYLNDSIYLKMVNRAEKYVYIQTPYLIIDDKLTNSIIFAAQSGVEVIIITPSVYDKFYVHAVTRSSYKRLIKAGVKVYEFTPGFIHSKLIISDGMVGVLGTANFDFRSLYLHFECSVWMYKTKALSQMCEDFRSVMSQCEIVSLEECEKRSFFQKILGFVLKPFSSFM